MVEQLDRV
jgi:hypothetical protein